jgi:predicted N-acetyltransferase YhbS
VRLVQVSRLQAAEVSLVATIDRSEHVDLQYRVVTASCNRSRRRSPRLRYGIRARGGILLGALDGERTVGLAIVHPAFEPLLAWLAFLHVSRPYRRGGAAQALWNVAADIAVANGAASIYVSATPTESAVGFYLRQCCRLAHPVHPDLFAAEPEDIHLVRSLR